MDIDRLMMFIIMFDACNTNDDLKEKPIIKTTTRQKRSVRNKYNNKHQFETSQNSSPKVKTFKRKL